MSHPRPVYNSSHSQSPENLVAIIYSWGKTMNRLFRRFGAVLIRVAALIVVASCAATSFAQQADTPKPAAAKKQAAAQSSEKPAESAVKPEPGAEPRPAPREASQDKDKDKDKEEEEEEHYDMTEAVPVVTHHQINVDGKLLKYSATAGRLPIKRGDGRIEAEMFYVAYTLDGQDGAKRPLTFAF